MGCKLRRFREGPIVSCISHRPPGHHKPAGTRLLHPYRILYLALKRFHRDEDTHGPQRTCDPYRVLYLAPLLPPLPLVSGMVLPPRLGIGVPPLEITRIFQGPGLLATPFPLPPTRRLGTTQLPFALPGGGSEKLPAHGAVLERNALNGSHGPLVPAPHEIDTGGPFPKSKPKEGDSGGKGGKKARAYPGDRKDRRKQRGVGQKTAEGGSEKSAGGWVRFPLLGGSTLDRW